MHYFVVVMGFLFAAVCLMLLSNAQCVAAYNKDAIINHKERAAAAKKTFSFLAITFFLSVPPKAKIQFDCLIKDTFMYKLDFNFNNYNSRHHFRHKMHTRVHVFVSSGNLLCGIFILLL